MIYKYMCIVVQEINNNNVDMYMPMTGVCVYIHHIYMDAEVRNSHISFIQHHHFWLMCIWGQVSSPSTTTGCRDTDKQLRKAKLYMPNASDNTNAWSEHKLTFSWLLNCALIFCTFIPSKPVYQMHAGGQMWGWPTVLSLLVALTTPTSVAPCPSMHTCNLLLPQWFVGWRETHFTTLWCSE